MQRKLIITSLVLSFLAISSFSASAGRYYDRDGYNGYRNGPPTISDSESNKDDWRSQKRQYQHEMATELLGLTDEQQELIKAIRDKEKTANETLRKKMREYRDQMRELTDSGNFDEEAIRAIAEEKAKLQVELAVSKARHHSKIHAVMTPEQQELAERLRSIRQNRKRNHRQGYGPGPGMGDGHGYGYGPGMGDGRGYGSGPGMGDGRGYGYGPGMDEERPDFE